MENSALLRRLLELYALRSGEYFEALKQLNRPVRKDDFIIVFEMVVRELVESLEKEGIKLYKIQEFLDEATKYGSDNS